MIEALGSDNNESTTMNIDLHALKGAALALREKLEFYAEQDEDVAELAEELHDLLEAAVDGKVLEVIEWEDVPGGMMIDDGVFEDFDGLEDAYDAFRMEITGGEGGLDEDYDDEDDDQ